MMLFPPSVVPSQLQLVHVTGTSSPEGVASEMLFDELLDEPLWPFTSSAAAANMVPSRRIVLLDIFMVVVGKVL